MDASIKFDGQILDITQVSEITRKKIINHMRSSYMVFRKQKPVDIEIIGDSIFFSYQYIKISYASGRYLLSCPDKKLQRKLRLHFNDFSFISPEMVTEELIDIIYNLYMNEVDKYVVHSLSEVEELSHLNILSPEDTSCRILHKNNEVEYTYFGDLSTSFIHLYRYKDNIYTGMKKMLTKYLWSMIDRSQLKYLFHVFGQKFTIRHYHYVLKNSDVIGQLYDENRLLVKWIARYYRKKGFKLTLSFYSQLKQNLLSDGLSNHQWKCLSNGAYTMTSTKDLIFYKNPSHLVHFCEWLSRMRNFKTTLVYHEFTDYYDRYKPTERRTSQNPNEWNNYLFISSMLNKTVRKSWKKNKQRSYYQSQLNRLMDYARDQNIKLTEKHSFDKLLNASERWHRENPPCDFHFGNIDLNKKFYSNEIDLLYDGVNFELLNTPQTLIDEGIKMQHCVGSYHYIQRSIENQNMIFHVKHKNLEATLEVYLDYNHSGNELWKKGQLYSFCDEPVEDDLIISAIDEFLKNRINKIELGIAV